MYVGVICLTSSLQIAMAVRSNFFSPSFTPKKTIKGGFFWVSCACSTSHAHGAFALLWCLKATALANSLQGTAIHCTMAEVQSCPVCYRRLVHPI